jgi:hypothetical protein
MTAARLTVALLAALALAPAAHARADAPRLTAPDGLRAFLLRADEPQTREYSRTPSFAWKPVPRTVRYEFQLSTSDTFRDGGIVYRSTKLKTPVISLPLSLPWITGKKSPRKTYALYARVRAVTQAGTTPWTDDYGFDMRWTGKGVPEPMSTFPGLLRWTPVPGASAYQVWLTERGKRIMTLTNVADQRDVYTFHTGAKWTSALQWRVRAVRMLYGQIANKLPSVSYGPWSPAYTAVNPPFEVGPLGPLAAVSDTVTDASEPEAAHRLTPGFVFTGNQSIFDEPGEKDDPELYRVYAFTDSDCVNTVFTGSVVGSPAWAPRVGGPLALPSSLSGITSARNKILIDTSGEGVLQVGQDGDETKPNESRKPAYEEAPGKTEEQPSEETPAEEETDEGAKDEGSKDGESKDGGESTDEGSEEAPAEIPLKFADDSTKIPPIELLDTKWPEGGYYWTVVAVKPVTPDPVETRLDANAAVAATTIVVEDTSGLEKGNKIEVGLPPEVATVKDVTGNTITLEGPLTAPHFAGDEVRLSADTIFYRDAELPQDVCAAGRVLRFGKMSEPALTIEGAPFASGLSTKGRLIPATRTHALFYGSPIVAWNPALGAHGYEVQWSKKAYPFNAAGEPIYTYSTSAVLPLTPGTWYYRVRGINLVMAPGAQQMAWSDPVKLVVAKPVFKIVK